MLSSIVTAMVPSSSSVVAAFRLFGLRNAGHAVGDRLDAGQRRTARGERPRQQEDQRDRGDLALVAGRLDQVQVGALDVGQRRRSAAGRARRAPSP